ncbi:MAG: hypothetical protein V9G10_07225 [Candidatus Nanopelagicales bacterium]
MVDAFLTRFNVPDDVPIEAKMVSRAIQSAQGQVEAQNFEIRKNVLKYDEVLNRQRQVIYAERQRVLRGRRPRRTQVRDIPRRHHRRRRSTQLHRRGLPGGLGPRAAVDRARRRCTRSASSIDAVEAEADGRSGLSTDMLTEVLQDDAQAAYDKRARSTRPSRSCASSSGSVILNVLDRKWREHLYEMDYLQEGIGLRAMAQRDPLVEYQQRGLRPVRGHDERHQGGDGRLHVPRAAERGRGV